MNIPQNKKQESFDLLNPERILQLLLSYWYIWAIGLVVGLGLAYFINSSAIKIYEAEASLLLKNENQSMNFSIFEQERLQPVFQNSIQNEINKLTTYSLAYETLLKLDLNIQFFESRLWGDFAYTRQKPVEVKVDWSQNQSVRGIFELKVLSEKTYQLKMREDWTFYFYNRDVKDFKPLETINFSGTFEFGKVAKNQYFNFIIDNKVAQIGDVLYFSLSDYHSLTQQVRNALAIKPMAKEGTGILITFQWKNPIDAELFLNQFIDVYLAKELEEKGMSTSKTVDFITEQLESIGDTLKFSGDKLTNFRADNKVYNLSEEGNIILQQLVSLESSLKELEFKKSYYLTIQDYLKNPVNELMVPSMVGIEDPMINSMVSNYIQLQSEKNRLDRVVNENQFAYTRDLNSKMQQLQKNLEESTKNAIAQLDNQYRKTRDMIRKTEAEISTLPSKESKLLNIEREFKINETIFTFLLERKAEKDIQKASFTNSHQILDRAMVKPTPIYPKVQKNYAIGGSLGFIIPVLFLIGFDFLFQKVRNIEELIDYIKVPFLGSVTRVDKDKNIEIHSPKNIEMEQFRNLRSSISFQFGLKEKGVIMVTSTQPGEGKSFVSTYLATTYALLGKKTLVLNLDIRKPSIHKNFNVDNKIGLTSYFSGEVDQIEDCILPTSTENLDLLPAGPHLWNSSEMINSEKFERIIQQLKSYYDYIIVDSAPITLISESKDFCKYSDIILFVVRQDYTNFNGLEFINKFNNLFPTQMGVIFNDVKFKRFGKYEYYYGGYYYGEK